MNKPTIEEIKKWWDENRGSHTYGGFTHAADLDEEEAKYIDHLIEQMEKLRRVKEYVYHWDVYSTTSELKAILSDNKPEEEKCCPSHQYWGGDDCPIHGQKDSPKCPECGGTTEHEKDCSNDSFAQWKKGKPESGDHPLDDDDFNSADEELKTYNLSPEAVKSIKTGLSQKGTIDRGSFADQPDEKGVDWEMWKGLAKLSDQPIKINAGTMRRIADAILELKQAILVKTNDFEQAFKAMTGELTGLKQRMGARKDNEKDFNKRIEALEKKVIDPEWEPPNDLVNRIGVLEKEVKRLKELTEL